MNIKKIVLKHKFLYELFFLITNKKLRKSRILKRIEKECFPKHSLQKDFIVSLTSYGDRISELHFTLYSLLCQTILPSRIIVWLTENDYENISKNQYLNYIGNSIIDFRITEDLKSYKKLIPTLKSFPNNIVITVDDDIYYDRYCFERLWNMHERNPDAVIANIGKKLKFCSNKLSPYSTWKNISRNELLSGLPIGCGAVLYPKNNFSSLVENEELFSKLAPSGDDLWFWINTLLNKKKIKILGYKSENLKYVNIYREYNLTNSETLNSKNVGGNKNDEQVRALLNYFNISDIQLKNMLDYEN